MQMENAIYTSLALATQICGERRMTMTNTQIKKETLLRFIANKMKWSDTPQEVKATMDKLKKLSYKALKEWAIINDFIDY